MEAQLWLTKYYGGAGKLLLPQDREYSSVHRPGTHTVPDWYKTINIEDVPRVLHSGHTRQRTSKGPFLPQLTQLLVRTRSSTLQGNSFPPQKADVNIYMKGENPAAASLQVNVQPELPASELPWTLTGCGVVWCGDTSRVRRSESKQFPTSLTPSTFSELL